MDKKSSVTPTFDVYWEFYRVELPYATYGLLVSDNLVVKAPPIAKWMIGRLWPECQVWIGKKHGNITLISRNFNNETEAE